jgi:hypothetical protein
MSSRVRSVANDLEADPAKTPRAECVRCFGRAFRLIQLMMLFGVGKADSDQDFVPAYS